MQLFLTALENKKVINKNKLILFFKYIHLLVLQMLNLLVFYFFELRSTLKFMGSTLYL